MTVFLVYKTDPWHSYNSREIIGVATRKKMAITLVKRQAKKEGHPFGRSSSADRWLLDFLEEKLQTQGYEGDGEFQIEELETNKLL